MSSLLQNPATIVTATLILALVIVLFIVVRLFILLYRTPRAYSIAIIGFPMSGKTTLITSLLGAILENRIQRTSIRLTSRETIEKVAADYALLMQGNRLARTTDRALFTYHAHMTVGGWFKKTYRMEIGDFPGAMSEEFTNGATKPLLAPDFEAYIDSADAFIFVIDVARCFTGFQFDGKINRDYIAQMTESIRSAWGIISNRHLAGERKVKSYPLVLAFTKFDIVNFLDDTSEQDTIEHAIRKYGFEQLPGLPGKIEMDSQRLRQQAEILAGAFSNLQSTLSHTSKNYSQVFTSSFAVLDGNRLGFEELLQAILPTS